MRHSKTVPNPEVPSTEWELSPEGVGQAELLARRPELFGMQIVYCSMQPKAAATALAIATHLDIPIVVEPDLAEVTSITNGFIENYDEVIAKLYAGHIKRIHGGETLAISLRRFNSAIERIINANPRLNSVGVVSHSNVLANFAAQFDPRSAYELHNAIAMPDHAELDWATKTFVRRFGYSRPN